MPKTLTMIDPRPNGSGGHYERGKTYTLADDIADYFLSIGVARYPTLQQSDVIAGRDPSTGAVSTIGTGRDPLGAPVVAVTGPGGGIGIPVGDTGLMLPATLRQQPNQPWPSVRPAYDGPITLIGWSDPPAWPNGEHDQYISIPRIYVPIVQDFSTIYPGPVPAEEFAQYWAAAYISCDIVEIDLPTTRRALRFVGPNSSARSMLIWERSGVESDQDALARVVNPIPANLNANAAGLVVRANKIGTSRAGYLLNIRSTTPAEISLTKFESNVGTTLRTQALSIGLSSALKTAGAVVMMRLRAVGDSITGSIWLDGADESEAVVIAATDSGVVSGQVAVSSATPNYEGVIDYISVAYGGDVAPLPGV